MRGNVVDLAVAVVIGAAFGAVIKAFVDGLINPLIAAIFGKHRPDSRCMVFHIRPRGVLDRPDPERRSSTSCWSRAAIYFVIVMPMNTLAERRKQGVEPEPEAPAEDVLLLQEIRDLHPGPRRRRLAQRLRRGQSQCGGRWSRSHSSCASAAGGTSPQPMSVSSRVCVGPGERLTSRSSRPGARRAQRALHPGDLARGVPEDVGRPHPQVVPAEPGQRFGSRPVALAHAGQRGVRRAVALHREPATRVGVAHHDVDRQVQRRGRRALEPTGTDRSDLEPRRPPTAGRSPRAGRRAPPGAPRARRGRRARAPRGEPGPAASVRSTSTWASSVG